MADFPKAPSAMPSINTSRAAIYVRSSNARDRALQLGACLEYAKQNGLHVEEDHIFVEEEDATDHVFSRPTMAALHQAIVRGAFGTLLVAKKDALFHSEDDLDGFTHMLATFGETLVIVGKTQLPQDRPSGSLAGGSTKVPERPAFVHALHEGYKQLTSSESGDLATRAGRVWEQVSPGLPASLPRSRAEAKHSTRHLLHKATATAASTGWNLLLRRLPGPIRRAIPDAGDARYPRSKQFHFWRETVASWWLIVPTYIAIVIVGLVRVAFSPGLSSLTNSGELARVTLISYIGALAGNQTPLVIAVTMGILVLLVILFGLGLAASSDRVREAFVIFLRHELPAVHEDWATNINEAVWQPGALKPDQLKQTASLLKDISVDSATRILGYLTRKHFKRIALMTMLTLLAVVLGVVLGVANVL